MNYKIFVLGFVRCLIRLIYSQKNEFFSIGCIAASDFWYVLALELKFAEFE
jgi:hypothetical protein